MALEKLQNVMVVTDGLGRFWPIEGDTIMKKIAVIFALAFAFTTGMAVVTVVAHTDQAMADSAPRQLSCIRSKRLRATAQAADGDAQE